MTIQDQQSEAALGDRFLLHENALLQASFPRPAKIRLIQNGRLIQETFGEALSHMVRSAGTYRIEAYLPAFGRYRPWVFANPIYVVTQ